MAAEAARVGNCDEASLLSSSSFAVAVAVAAALASSFKLPASNFQLPASNIQLELPELVRECSVCAGAAESGKSEVSALWQARCRGFRVSAELVQCRPLALPASALWATFTRWRQRQSILTVSCEAPPGLNLAKQPRSKLKASWSS